MIRCLLATLFFLARCVQAEDSQVVAELGNRLTVYQAVAGEFQQQKYLPFMATPLVSSGTFTATLETGLRWHVLKPVESVMIVDNQGVTLNGQSMRDSGIGKVMASMMAGFMNGNLRALDSQFHLQGEFSEQGWQLKMRPASLLLAQVLDSIDVAGTDTVSSIIVREKSGSHTVMTFSEMQEFEASGQGQLE